MVLTVGQSKFRFVMFCDTSFVGQRVNYMG